MARTNKAKVGKDSHLKCRGYIKIQQVDLLTLETGAGI